MTQILLLLRSYILNGKMTTTTTTTTTGKKIFLEVCESQKSSKIKSWVVLKNFFKNMSVTECTNVGFLQQQPLDFQPDSVTFNSTEVSKPMKSVRP